MQQQVLGRRTRATFRGRGGWPVNTGTPANCPPEREVRQLVQFLWRNFPSHSVGSLCRSGASLWGNSCSEWVRKAKCYRKDDRLHGPHGLGREAGPAEKEPRKRSWSSFTTDLPEDPGKSHTSMASLALNVYDSKNLRRNSSRNLLENVTR